MTTSWLKEAAEEQLGFFKELFSLWIKVLGVGFGLWFVIVAGSYLVSLAVIQALPGEKLGYWLAEHVDRLGLDEIRSWRQVVTWDQVTVTPVPHDCDFMKAPIGNKYCHYESRVESVRTRVGEDGDPEISFDEGKTWEWNREKVEPSVYVSWVKVQD